MSAIDRADLRHCRALLVEGSRTFLAASHLLPRAVREPATALYAFCRVADDAIDRCADGDIAWALAGLRRRLDAIYGAAPIGSAAERAPDRAFAAVVRTHAIPRALPEALLDGFAWDAAGRRYETLEALLEYAARVAGTVGAMMALVMGVRDGAALARACDLGVAMQLSNIARDVGEDARAGRVYLPLSWLREGGLDVEAWLGAPSHEPAVAASLARLLAEARVLYDRVEAGIALLPPRCRVGIDAARRLYAAIGDAVASNGFDAVATRAVVPAARKAALLVRAAVSPARTADADVPALAATRGLVEAVALVPAEAAGLARAPAAAARDASARAPAGSRAAWVIDLFDRVERRRMGRSGMQHA